LGNLSEEIRTALEVLADEASTVAALIDAKDDYRIVWANRRLRELLPRVGAVANVVGMRWGGRCPFCFGINALEAIDKVVRTGEPVYGEERPFGARVSSRFGETTYWNWKILPAASEGCPGCVLVMAENVTDRVARKAEEHRREVQFSGVVLDLPVGVATVDPTDFRLLDANDIWLSYLPPEHQTRESIGKTLQEIMPNLEYSGLADVLRRVASTREFFSAHEFEVKDPIRGSIWWNLAVRLMQTEGGKEALLVTAWEVTDQVNARRRAEVSRQRAEAMLQVQQAISSSLALDHVLSLITSYARQLMNSAAASVFLVSEDGRSFVPRGATGIDFTESGVKAIASEDSVAARAIRTRRAVAVSGSDTPEARVLPLLESGRPIISIAAAPVEAEAEPIGVIEVYNDQDRRFTNDEIDTLNALASAAATAILNARLYEDARRVRDELEVRNRALDAERKLLGAALDSMPDAVMVADSKGLVIRANGAARALCRLDEGEVVPVSEIVEKMQLLTLEGSQVKPDDFPLARALRGEEVRNSEYVLVEPDVGLRYRSVSAAPVRDKEGNVIYAVMVGHDITDQKLAQASLQEDYERERRIAQTFQRALLPDVAASLDGLQLAAKYEAGLRESEIGGDFYDLFPVGEGKYAVVIGDVAGKGLSAAVQIALAKYAIRSYAYEDPSPSRVVSRVNDAICRDRAVGDFVTVFYGVLDPSQRTLTFANAGHEPPLLSRSDGRVERLLSGGLVMGVEPGFEYNDVSVQLEVGDRLLLYTDGVSEARKESGEILGEDRVRDFWRELEGRSARDLLEAVFEWAREFSEGHFHDDAALVVITVTG